VETERIRASPPDVVDQRGTATAGRSPRAEPPPGGRSGAGAEVYAILHLESDKAWVTAKSRRTPPTGGEPALVDGQLTARRGFAERRGEQIKRSADHSPAHAQSITSSKLPLQTRHVLVFTGVDFK